MERKIFNFESIVLDDMTFEKEGYFPSAFGPTSNKFIYATCRFCGEPSRVRKGQFVKRGSACHKECRFKEQSIAGSPFVDPNVREKAAKTNKKKYGTEFASQNKEIAKKISSTRKTPESKAKSVATNLERYGVENVFQAEEIKERIKERNIQKYGTPSAMQNEEIKNKAQNTLKERYGVENMAWIPGVQEARQQTFNETIKEDILGNYVLINFLRSEAFWDELAKSNNLVELCERFNLPYQSVASTLSRDEFKERFQTTYSYPKHQKQNEISDIIRSWGLEVECSSRSVISPSELDIYIPSKKVAIELNGSYWHSEAILEPIKARNKHRDKLEKCRSKGIRLLNIFERTWDDRSEQILGFMKSVLGVNDRRIFARKCSLSETFESAFVDKNHIQGFSGKTIKFFNLVIDGEVVGSMTAARHHRQGLEGNPVVLNRLCFANSVSVVGGASKLFKAFCDWAKKDGYDRVISFSDNCWTEGGIYKELNFTLDREYPPDYFYWDRNRKNYVSKQTQRKKTTNCPEGMTERDWAMQRGLYRIWDCGKKVWIYRL